MQKGWWGIWGRCGEAGVTCPERGAGIWGFLVVFLYVMWRVDCKTCGVVVEKVPWASGKHHLTNGTCTFWRQTSWNQVCHAVEYIVGWGLDHRVLGPIRAIGVDEIQYAKEHKYLTLVQPASLRRTSSMFLKACSYIGRNLLDHSVRDIA